MHDETGVRQRHGRRRHGGNVKSSMLLEIVQRTFKSPASKAGLVIFAIILIGCIFAPLIAPYGVNEIDTRNMYASPSASHIMGTDALGRDVFSRLLYGGRYSLSLGFSASIFQTLLAMIVGCIAGYFGGKTETFVMRAMDVWSALPGTLLCILISSSQGPGFFNTVLALSIGGIPGGVRMMRGQILSERTKEYLEAAESINCSKVSIMFRHLLPNVCSPMIISFTMGIGQTITAAAGLSYIGLGVQPPSPEWGAMLSDARAHILNYPYLILFPGIFIACTILATNLIGDGLRDAMDPRMRK